MNTRASIHSRPRAAFTLVELVAVIVVLAIMAGVALPKFINHADKAKVSAAQGARAALADAVQQYYMTELSNGRPGAYPSNLEFALQDGTNERLLNPWHDSRMPVYNTDRGGPNKWYMNYKTIDRAVSSRWGSIWYNPDNGRVCFRVPDQGSTQATLDLFNLVNQANCTSLGQNRR